MAAEELKPNNTNFSAINKPASAVRAFSNSEKRKCSHGNGKEGSVEATSCPQGEHVSELQPRAAEWWVVWPVGRRQALCLGFKFKLGVYNRLSIHGNEPLFLFGDIVPV